MTRKEALKTNHLFISMFTEAFQNDMGYRKKAVIGLESALLDYLPEQKQING